MGAFGGLDVDVWTPNTCYLWRWSNLRHIGLYLDHREHPAPSPDHVWPRKLRQLQDIGWTLWTIFLPFKDTDLAAGIRTADGAADGRSAAAQAAAAGLEFGATVYLDLESQVLSGGLAAGAGALTPEGRYVVDWLEAVRRAGYGAGVYGSWLDVTRQALLSPLLDRYRPALWPFAAIIGSRGKWTPDTFTLVPALPKEWPVSPNGRAWADAARVVGCQYDQNHSATALTWPTVDGRPEGRSPKPRDVDWDATRMHDPSHPWANAVPAVAARRDNPDFLDVFVVRPTVIEHATRGRSARLEASTSLRLAPGDCGPTPEPVADGFDLSAAAVSRASGCADLFVVGLDGFVRTVWTNPRETFPAHAWPLNPAPGTQARRASPLAAVSRAPDRVDVFYADRSHRLVTQWWSPSQTDWSTARRVVDGPLVAGGSNIAALPAPTDRPNTPPTAIPDRLDVFYVSFDYRDPDASGSWAVTHAHWDPGHDWTSAATPLTGVAGGSGVAAVRDGTGTVHVMAQSLDRTALRYGVLDTSGGWTVGPGPGRLPSGSGSGSVPGPGAQADSWMALRLAALRDAVVLVGMTRRGRLAWATLTGAKWSAPRSEAPTADPDGFPAAVFSTKCPLALAARGPSDLDVVGVDETGAVVLRSLHVLADGTARLGPG